MPSIPNVINVPWSVGGSSPTNLWAAGYAWNTRTVRGVPLLLHWDGKTWTLAKTPPVSDGEFMDVDARAPDDAWAVGDDDNGALAMHWDGNKWRIASPPSP